MHSLTPAEYRYLREAIQAVAENHQPLARDEPLCYAANKYEEENHGERRAYHASRVCLAATVYFLKHHSTYTPSNAFLSEHFERPLPELVRDLQLVRYLEQRYQEKNVVIIPPSFEEEKAHIAQELAELFAKPKWVALEAFDPSLATDYYDGRNQAILRGLLTGQYLSYKAVGEAFDITGSRAAQVVSRQLRKWNHPARYGRYFTVTPAKQTGSKARVDFKRIQFNQRDEDGSLSMDRYDGLTFEELYAHLQTFFAELGTVLHLHVPSSFPH
jgi:hypothetical protein